MEPETPKTERDSLIDLAVSEALGKSGRHWDLYRGLEGVRRDEEIPANSWEQFPRLCVGLGERLLSREAILEQEQADWLVMQIATDLIWIGGFILVGSRIEHGPELIAPYLRGCLKKADTDTGRFNIKLLESHSHWCYCAREIDALNEPPPLHFAMAAESTLTMAALVLDLALENNLLDSPPETVPAG